MSFDYALPLQENKGENSMGILEGQLVDNLGVGSITIPKQKPFFRSIIPEIDSYKDGTINVELNRELENVTRYDHYLKDIKWDDLKPDLIEDFGFIKITMLVINNIAFEDWGYIYFPMKSPNRNDKRLIELLGKEVKNVKRGQKITIFISGGHFAGHHIAEESIVTHNSDLPRPLLEAHKLFVEEQLARENMSKTTRRGYSYDILEFIDDYNKSSMKKLTITNQLSIKLVNDYFIKLDALNKKGSTRHRKVAAIKKFVKFLESNNWVESNISDSIIWPKIEEDEPRPLSENQYKAFLRETAVSIRDHAMFELLVQTGIRLSEMTSLTLENIFIPKVPSQDHVTGVGYIRVKRKGNKFQELALSYKACKVIKEYLKIRPQSEYDRLFLTKYGKPISNRGVQWLFKKYAKQAGLPDWAHVHTLRTTNFTYKLAKGVDVRTVQHNAGHKNIATTSRYLAYVKEAGIKSAQDMPL